MLKYKKIMGKVALLFIIAGMITGVITNELNQKNDWDFHIEYIQDKNEKSLCNSVWIKHFLIGEQKVSAYHFGEPKGWEKYANFFHLYGESKSKEPLHIKLKNADSLSIMLYKGPEEGKLKLRSKNEEKIIDLYAPTGEDIVYTVDIGRTEHEHNVVHSIATFLIILLILGIVTGIIYKDSRGIVLAQLGLYYCLYIKSEIMFFSTAGKVIMCVLAILSGYIVHLSQRSNLLSKYKTPKVRACMIALSLYMSFATIGQPLILKETTIYIDVSILMYWLILSIFMYLLIVASIYSIEVMIVKLKKSSKKLNVGHKILIFISMFSIGTLWLLINYPANMPADTISLWQIIKGDYAYWSGHPFYYYLTIKGLLALADSPVFVAIVQYGFFCLISTKILIYVAKRGVSYLGCILCGIGFMLIPSTGIGQVTLLKDYPQSTALLWLTFLIFKLVLEGEKVISPKYILESITALLLVALYRPNGLVTLYFSVIMIIFMARAFSKKKRMLMIGALISTVFIYNGMNMAARFMVEPGIDVEMKSDALLNKMICDNLSSVLVSGEKLSKETIDFMESHAPLEVWEENYGIYNLRAHSLAPIESIANSYSGKELIPYLVDSAVRAPGITIKTRLNKLNIFWDVTPVEGHQIYMHRSVFANRYNIVKQDNVLSSLFTKYVINNSNSMKVMGILFFNTGVYVIVLLILAFVLYKHNKKGLYMYIPVGGNILSLLVSSNWQDYRFFYFVLPLTLCILLFTLVIARESLSEGDLEDKVENENGTN